MKDWNKIEDWRLKDIKAPLEDKLRKAVAETAAIQRKLVLTQAEVQYHRAEAEALRAQVQEQQGPEATRSLLATCRDILAKIQNQPFDVAAVLGALETILGVSPHAPCTQGLHKAADEAKTRGEALDPAQAEVLDRFLAACPRLDPHIAGPETWVSHACLVECLGYWTREAGVRNIDEHWLYTRLKTVCNDCFGYRAQGLTYPVKPALPPAPEKKQEEPVPSPTASVASVPSFLLEEALRRLDSVRGEVNDSYPRADLEERMGALLKGYHVFEDRIRNLTRASKHHTSFELVTVPGPGDEGSAPPAIRDAVFLSEDQVWYHPETDPPSQVVLVARDVGEWVDRVTGGTLCLSVHAGAIVPSLLMTTGRKFWSRCPPFQIYKERVQRGERWVLCRVGVPAHVHVVGVMFALFRAPREGDVLPRQYGILDSNGAYLGYWTRLSDKAEPEVSMSTADEPVDLPSLMRAPRAGQVWFRRADNGRVESGFVLRGWNASNACWETRCGLVYGIPSPTTPVPDALRMVAGNAFLARDASLLQEAKSIVPEQRWLWQRADTDNEDVPHYGDPFELQVVLTPEHGDGWGQGLPPGLPPPCTPTPHCFGVVDAENHFRGVWTMVSDAPEIS